MPQIDRERWPDLQPLLDEALTLAPEALAAWLDELRTRSPDLAAELASLLAGEGRADQQGFLTDRPAVTLAGLQLGAYTLERTLGHGGMGSVWLARRTDGRFEGRAAVKIMNLALLSPTGQARFRREGTVLARLAHPNVARLLDAGVAPSGQPYLVIEHVDGTRIDVFAGEHRLPPEERIGLVLQVLDALGHAHANLIVHRDIKPSNILVTRDGMVKLLDFGIAKLLEEGEDGRTALTADGHVLTPEYAAPEQVRGEAITTATDIYATGVLLYQLLSGRHPTSTATSAPSAAEVVRAVLEVEPARLGRGDLDSILAKALRKSPAERYQTVAAFADDLRRYLRQEPVSARPDSLAYRARKFVRRHRAAVAAVGIVAAALVGATLFSVLQMREARAQRDAAFRDARRAEAMVALQGVLAGDSRGPDGQPLSAGERIALAERVLERKFLREPWLVAEVMVDLSGRFYDTGDREAQRRMLARAGAISREAGLLAQLAFADCIRAGSWWFDNQLDSARADLTEAQAALARAGATADAVVEAACLEAEGKLLAASGQADSGLTRLRRAVETAPEGGQRNHAITALADVLRLSGRAREAIPYLFRLLAALENEGWDETEVYPNTFTFLERPLSELGEFAAIDSALRAVMAARETAAGPGGVPALFAFLHGLNQLRLGALDSADLWLARAARDTTQDAGMMANWMPVALSQLRLDQGRLTEARAAIRQLPGGLRGRRATGVMLRARFRRANGDPAGAATMLED
ncbi:MAG: serine/threonine protein kinase, partial [Gemmatimonadota bacterium]|nr:serine/threonine protein kinase [Gemmatimonadota bacterium]